MVIRPHLRTLQALQSNPINLTLAPRSVGDLKLSFWHIVDIVGGDAVSGVWGCARLRPGPGADRPQHRPGRR